MKPVTRHHLRLVAIIGLIAYAIVRFFLVGALFASHGVNPWVFLAIDCLTAITYVLGLEHLVVALKDTRFHAGQLLAWGFLAAASFAAPYAYVFVASHTLPDGLALGLGIVIVLLLANAVIGLLKRLRRNRTK